MGHLALCGSGEDIIKVMASHPAYQDAFSTFMRALFEEDGPLPHYYRHYIAMMAASRHQCSVLVEEQKVLFLESGGPPKWLEGLIYAPPKLQALQYTNKLLAHRPWLFERSDVTDLLKVSWSLSELAQAICILAQFHSLCSLVHGSGMEAANCEQNMPTRSVVEPSLSGSPSSQELSEGGVEVLLKRMKTLSTSTSDLPEEKVIESFEHLKHQTADLSSPPIDVIDGQTLHTYAHLSPDPDYTYVDFRKRQAKTLFPTMNTQECSWEEHGYSVLRELYYEATDLIDNKFRTAYRLTYYTCGNIKQVNTSPFRTGVWNYLHCLFGIRHNNYDYKRVDQLLDRNLKRFLKAVACFPERLLPTEWQPPLMNGFLDSEKIHVLVLVVEARLQAELLYALRAITNYLTQ